MSFFNKILTSLKSNFSSDSVNLVTPAKLVKELSELSKEYGLSPNEMSRLVDDIFYGKHSSGEEILKNVSAKYNVPPELIVYIIKNVEYK